METEGLMNPSGETQVIATASLELVENEARLERLQAGPAGGEALRFSAWSHGELLKAPLLMEESELVALLHLAVQRGVLSQGFVSRLRERIEI